MMKFGSIQLLGNFYFIFFSIILYLPIILSKTENNTTDFEKINKSNSNLLLNNTLLKNKNNSLKIIPGIKTRRLESSNHVTLTVKGSGNTKVINKFDFQPAYSVRVLDSGKY